MPAIDPVVLGIDPGSLHVGFAAITQKGSHLQHIESGTIDVRSSLPLGERLYFIHTRLDELLTRLAPTTVAIESIFYAKNVRSTATLAHARGIVLLSSAQHATPVAEYSPMEVKKAVVGFGRATKEQVAQMMQRLFRMEKGMKVSLDATDAMAVALCHLNHASTMRRMKPEVTL